MTDSRPRDNASLRDPALLRAQWHARQLRRSAAGPQAEWRLRATRVVAGVLLTAVACLHGQGWLELPLVQRIDREIYDARVRLQQPEPDPRVAVVDIDAASIVEYGRWPWPRATVADLLERLGKEQRVAAIGIDLLVAEAPEDADRRLIARLRADPRFTAMDDALAKVARTLDHDSRLAGVIAAQPIALGWQRLHARSDAPAHLRAMPRPVMSAGDPRTAGFRPARFQDHAANLPLLQQAARASGFTDPTVDDDGVVRRLPLLAEHDGGIYESMSVALLRLALGAPEVSLRPDGLAIRGKTGSVDLPTDQTLRALLPNTGGVDAGPEEGEARAARFQTFSAADVLAGRLAEASLAGRIVLVGSSAPGVAPLWLTADGRRRSSAELHATFLSAALGGGLQRQPVFARSADLLATAVTGLALSVLMPGVSALGVLLAGVLATLSLLAWNGVAFSNLGWVLPVGGSLLLVMALGVFNLIAGYFAEGRSRRAMLHLFGQYVGPQLVERMALDPNHFRMDGEDKELTILFCDIRGFTRIGETMEPPHLREYLNTFLTAMTDVVHRYNGTVDKYIGDAVMAFWGAPVDDPLHADHAVAAALAMQDEARRLNDIFAARGWPLLSVGIGLNTGLVRVGDMGSRARRTYTVIGDTVNLAARFEQLTKECGVSVVAGENTVIDARSHRFREIGLRRVPGRSEPVRVFEPLGAAAGDLRGGARVVPMAPGEGAVRAADDGPAVAARVPDAAAIASARGNAAS